MWRLLILAGILSFSSIGAEVIDLKYSPNLKVKVVLLEKGRRDPTKTIEDLEVQGYTIHDVKLIAGNDNGFLETMVITYHERQNYSKMEQDNSHIPLYR